MCEGAVSNMVRFRRSSSVLDRWFLPALLIGCCLLVERCQSQGITFIGPKIIHPLRNYTVIVTNTFNQNVRLDVELEGKMNNEKSRTPLILRKQSMRPVTFWVGDVQESDYVLSVRSTDPRTSYSHSVDLTFLNKTTSTFIQTDKPIYKPGDVINFRVVSVYHNTRPVVDNTIVNISLTDGEHNSIRMWQYARLRRGIFESRVQLASSPVLGNWSLTVKTSEEEITKYILVKEYVLPIFYVKVTAPDVQLVRKKTITLDIEAHYTFNKYVNGNATVALYLEPTNRRPDHVQKFDITGKKTITFALKEPVEIEYPHDFKEVKVVATMMEAFTNRTLNVTEYIPVYENPYKITVLKTMPRFWPGDPYKVEVSVEKHNGMVVEDKKSIEITLEYEGDEESDTVRGTYTLSETGLLSLELNPPEWANQVSISALYDSVEYENLDKIEAAQTISKQYIRVFVSPKNKIRIGKDIRFNVQCSEAPGYIFYIVLSKGSIVDHSSIYLGKGKAVTQKLILKADMAPKATLIVFYHKGDYLLYDDVELVFETLENDLKLTIDSDDYYPAQDIVIDVDATKDSFVAFQAIDQSALHLGNDGHDITKEDVYNELTRYGQNTDVGFEFDPFHVMGLFLKSSGELDAAKSRQSVSRMTRYSRNIKPKQQAVHIRTQFPEAWLWKNITMDGRRTTKQFIDTIPDTITTWQLTGFALSPTTGLGIINQPISFLVQQPFYIVANLPYSIKRGEVTLIQVTIFNFLGHDVTADVTLFNKNEEIDFVDQSSSDNTRRTKAAIVPDNNGKQISFMIKAKKLGEIAIKVQATTLVKSDALEHMLRVTPESRRYERNEGRFIQNSKHETKSTPLKFNIPRDVDEGSVAIVFSLDPDLLGTPIKNLENLIRLPTGCGEQNMLHFVPNIVIMDYLTQALGKPNAQAMNTARNYLASGYQNQLKYKRSDGAFSVWGQRDTSGSVFLTAFIASSFKIAAKYITVDGTIVSNALNWLASKQQPSGQFVEVGSVIHSDMQGALRTTSFALTAFTLIAFLENNQLSQHRRTIDKSLNYLVNNLHQMTDSYDLALATYALSLRMHASRRDFLNKLLESSIFNAATTERYWSRGAASVEVAGYALLSYVLQDQIVDGTPIMRWLNSQRYATGAFAGTQDTFVGLKALATFAARTSGQKNDYRVRILYEPNARITFDIDHAHQLTIQEYTLPSHIRNVKVEIEGIGNGFYQIAYQYYKNIEKETTFSFDLDVVMLNTTTYDVQQLKICVAYVPKEAYQRSNMALVEVFFPSGMIAYSDSVRDLSYGEIKNTELRFSATSVAVYYDSLGTQSKCFEITAYRKYKVAYHLPAYVVVYDYYNQDRFAIKSYEGKVMQLCDICEDEDCETLSC